MKFQWGKGKGMLKIHLYAHMHFAVWYSIMFFPIIMIFFNCLEQIENPVSVFFSSNNAHNSFIKGMCCPDLVKEHVKDSLLTDKYSP